MALINDARMMSQMWQLAPRLALLLTLPDPAPVDKIPQIAVGH